MAQIIVELPQIAANHAEECAQQLGFASAADWIREWLINSVKGVEKNRKQKTIDTLAKKIDNEIEALYDDGRVAPEPVITLPKP